MHIPEGYLSPSTCAVMYAASAPFWYVATQRLKGLLATRLVPLISIMAAFSFVIMMFNFPVIGGTTSHAVGIGVAATVLGPWGAIIALSVALILQAIFFGDGGILAIGANCFNIAVAGSLVAWGIYRALAGRAPLTAPRRALAGAVAGYLGVNVAALLTAVEVGLQPALFRDAGGAPLYAFYPLSVAVPAMMIPHLTFVGIAEALITFGVIAYLQRSDPALLRPGAPDAGTSPAARSRRGRWRPLLIGLLALALLSPLGLLASGSAWGEWGADEVVAEQAAFHLRELGDADRAALAAELDRYAGRSADPVVAENLRAAGARLREGDDTGAASLVQARIETLRAADRAEYPRIAALSDAAPEPSGLRRWGEWWSAPIPDYAPAFLRNEVAGYIISALVGGGLAIAVTWLVGRLFARPPQGDDRDPSGTPETSPSGD